MKRESIISERTKLISLILIILVLGGLIFYGFIAIFIHIQNWQYNGFLISKEIDATILRAFLVFIACTNMVSKSREVDVQAKELLKRMLCLMLAHDEDA